MATKRSRPRAWPKVWQRFGPLPAWAEARIVAADIGQLDTWLDGLLDAADLTGLLGPADDPACR